MTEKHILRNNSSDWWRNLSRVQKESNKLIYKKDYKFITYKDIDEMYYLCLTFLM